MNVTPLAWILTVTIMLAVLIVDAVIIGRRPHVPTTKECLFFVGLFVSLALLFGLGILLVSGQAYAFEFFQGWLTEYSLSLDNLFIFLIIMSKMAVPPKNQQFALLVGIMLALVFRGMFIALGAALISNLAWIFFVFGLWLLYTAFDLIRDYLKKDADDDADRAAEGRLMRWIKRTVPETGGFVGDKIFVRQEGKILATSMFFVIVALGTTDVMFALDSIPAIYGLTSEPYIVFTANVFALMGLRQLYFLLGDALKKLVYLPIGLSVLLTFIGIKLLLHAAEHYGLGELIGHSVEIPSAVSLIVIVGCLVVTAVASIIKTRRDENAELK